MKLAYITAQVPWGRAETFIISEMLSIKKNDIKLVIIPRTPPKEVFHQEAQSLLADALWLPLVNFRISIFCLYSFLTNLRAWQILFNICRHSRNCRIILKNLAVFPKGLYIARLLQKKGIEHIHVHWGSTTATMAYIASQVSNIPWSLTLHRWDIAENNMLEEKIKNTIFARAINKAGKEEILQLIDKKYENKIQVIHMGVKVLPLTDKIKTSVIPAIVCAANLVEVKGHKYLLKALAILRDRGYKIKCLFLGAGLEKETILKEIKTLNLTSQLELRGMVPHEQVQKIFCEETDIVVLPSIVTEKGEKEGIPVVLMEAMSYGIPVISTNTGGIPELLAGEAGIIVEEKNAEHLANSLEKIIQNKELAKEIGMRGYHKVKEEFNLDKNVEKLLGMMKG